MSVLCRLPDGREANATVQHCLEMGGTPYHLKNGVYIPVSSEEKAVLQGNAKVAPALGSMDKNSASISGTHSFWDIANFNENAMMWLALIVLAKQGNQGLKIVNDFLSGLVKGMNDALDSLCRAASANRIAAWAAPRLLSLQMERFGLLTQSQAGGFDIGLSVITGAQVAEDLATNLPWNFLKEQDTSFPDQVVLGDRVTNIKEEHTAWGFGKGASGLQRKAKASRELNKET